MINKHANTHIHQFDYILSYPSYVLVPDDAGLSAETMIIFKDSYEVFDIESNFADQIMYSIWPGNLNTYRFTSTAILGAENRILLYNYVDTAANDTSLLRQCINKHNIDCTRQKTPYFPQGSFQLTALPRFWEEMENANILYLSRNKFSIISVKTKTNLHYN